MKYKLMKVFQLPFDFNDYCKWQNVIDYVFGEDSYISEKKDMVKWLVREQLKENISNHRVKIQNQLNTYLIENGAEIGEEVILDDE